ncbi:AI-2E family transporter [soil metagenome]
MTDHPSANKRPGPSTPARDPFIRKTVTVVAITAITGLLLALFVLGIDILLAAFGGVLIAVLLRAFTNLLTRYTPLPDGWALTAVILLILALMGVGGWLLMPQIVEQVGEFTEQAPGIIAEIEQFLRQYGWGQTVLEQVQNGEMQDGVVDDAAGGVGGFFSVLSAWSAYLLTAVFVGLFAAANPTLYQDGIVHLFPLRHRSRVRELVGEMGYTLRWWLIGQGFAMLLIGVSTTLVLWILDIPLAVPIGIIVGLLGFIPYLGPIIGLVPVMAVGATQGTTTLLYLFLAYTAVQLLEGYVATPLIQHRTVFLPPVFTVIAQILLGTLLGILGFIFATPLAAAVLVLTRFYRTDILGDREVENGDDDE